MIHDTPYLAWLFIFIVAPTLIMWSVFYSSLWKYKKTFIHCIITALLAGLLWDIFAIATKMWTWPDGCCVLPRVGPLPLEEVLFIVFVTCLVCTTTLVAREIYLSHLKHGKLR